MNPAKRKPAPERHPEQWYVEPAWCVELLFGLIASQLRTWWGKSHVVWDPACGRGTILDVALKHGFLDRVGSDIASRGAKGKHAFSNADFLKLSDIANVLSWGQKLSIICNPPYGVEAEKFARQALNLATGYVAILVPLSWLASRTRHALFTDHPPETIAILSSRPSMPPGDKIAELGDQAFRNGKVDYCWIIWNRQKPKSSTRTVWLKRPDVAP